MSLAPAGSYAAPMTCRPPDLRRANTKVLPPGYTWTCDDCGAVWKVRGTVAWGGVYDVQWMCLLAPGATDPVATRLTALEARTVVVHRALASVTAIAVNKSVDLPVTWAAAFVDAAYDVEVLLPAALIGKVTTTVKSKSRSGAVITVAAAVVVVAGSVLDVTATRYGAPA